MTTNAATPGGLEARPPAPVKERTPAEIEADIERTRDDLAETIDALASRLDVKTRAKDRLRLVRDRATDDNGRPTPVTLAAAGGVVVVVLLVALRRRGRR